MADSVANALKRANDAIDNVRGRGIPFNPADEATLGVLMAAVELLAIIADKLPEKPPTSL